MNSPKLLDSGLRLKTRPALRFAGQITGVEGYLESAAIGLLAGRFAAADSADVVPPPVTTALGALLAHITGGHISDGHAKTFQPMNINFGLFPEIETPRKDADGRRLKGKERGRARKRLISRRALDDIGKWLGDKPLAAE